MTPQQIEALVLRSIEQVNMTRVPEAQLQVAPDAPLFGEGSPLDSLGLVSLLIDIEQALEDQGVQLVLSDERAMSQARSPFRSVPALVDYIGDALRGL